MKKVIAGLTALSMLAFATPAFADMNSSNVSFGVTNSGAIINVTSADANTGGNTAGGSKGGSGGEGGDVEVDGDGDYNNGGSSAGNGGNGGNASAGGLVETGDASADAGSLNSLNTTDIGIGGGGDDECGCDDMNSSYVGGSVSNSGHIVDITAANANTGDNRAKGSRGGRGGQGGEIEVDGDGDYNNGGASAGTGGAGGAGGLGGEVATGEAISNAGSINVMNTTLVRVRN